MALIEWEEKFSVNNSEIDEQHKKWIEIYNDVHEKLLQSDTEIGMKLAAEALQSMQDYADYHFKAEEEFLRQIDYPELVKHKRMHTDFDSQIYQYNRDIREGNMVLNTKILKILRNWLIDHILNEDKKFSVYAAKKV